MTLFIILGFIAILIIGVSTIATRYKKYQSNHDFACAYRNKFIELADAFFHTYNPYDRTGTINNELYFWLTKNVNKMQGLLGRLGIMDYLSAFQIYQISDYQILINTLPKFRTNQIENFDVTSTDDCLLRYIGLLEERLELAGKKIVNPIVWFREGFQQIVSIPFRIFNWFGILSDGSVSKIMANVIFKFFAGVGALITLFSGIVTIIQGKEQTIAFFRKILGK